MKRKIYNSLLEWKKDINKKPLILLGARQVGKTYILKKFCEKEYENFIYLNLFDHEEIVNMYAEPISSEEKFLKLKAILNCNIELKNTILFIDEIQESEELISNLKFLNENHNNVNIVCAGSLLGVKLKRSHFSFPVGKVTMLNMYPMDYEEFLLALNENSLIDEIKTCYFKNKKMISALHDKALGLYRLYLCTGGMPESVQGIVNASKDVTKYDTNILSNILTSYFKDMSKYVSNNSESIKIEKLYKSIPAQLSMGLKKFQYNKIESGAKSRSYETALDWLLESKLLIQSNMVSNPEIPLKGFIKEDYYKLFLNDIGFLTHLLEIKYGDILVDNMSLYKGVITENYVACQLVQNNISLYYWTSNRTAEVDFLLYNEDGIIPVEVKAGDSTKSKSLKIYMEKFKPKYAIRISSKNFGFVNNIKSIPLYAVFCIK